MGAVIGPPLFNLIPEILSSNNDQKPKKSSPKRQKCDEAQVISTRAKEELISTNGFLVLKLKWIFIIMQRQCLL